MNNSTVFLDANIILEATLSNRKHATIAQNYIVRYPTIISPLTAHLLVYFGQRDGLELSYLTNLLAKYRFTSFGNTEITWAIANHIGNDFEDALQVGCAVMGDCKTFVTFDQKLAQRYQQHISVELLA